VENSRKSKACLGTRFLGRVRRSSRWRSRTARGACLGSWGAWKATEMKKGRSRPAASRRWSIAALAHRSELWSTLPSTMRQCPFQLGSSGRQGLLGAGR
jgi:hypothetical protein